MSHRFLPSLKQIHEASKSLPDPVEWPDDLYVVTIKAKEKTVGIEFKRIKFTVSGERSHRWIYEGKVLIRMRDASQSKPQKTAETPTEPTPEDGFIDKLRDLLS